MPPEPGLLRPCTVDMEEMFDLEDTPEPGGLSFPVTEGEMVSLLRQNLRQIRKKRAPRAAVVAALLRLHELDGLQSWRDHEALAVHYLSQQQPQSACSVLQEGLAQLKGQPRLGRARRALEALLEQAARQVAAEPARGRRAASLPGKAARGRPDAEVTRKVEPPSEEPAAKAQAPVGSSRSDPARRAPADAQPGAPEPQAAATVLDDVPFDLSFRMQDCLALIEALAAAVDLGQSHRRLALLGHSVSVADRFDQLLCLESLQGVEQLPHQIETVKRVLRVLRGRALLADEVGLGKTIEAAMILSECLHRSLVDRVLILVPAALVGQWREELSSKFGLTLQTTEDNDYRSDTEGFWSRHRRIITSLELARRQPHAGRVSARAYDLIIVDEAHRLKRSSTLGHKLVNSLRSRFLLLLTATPVENDLEELYNIITLLRPGQLSTRGEFRRLFVSRGDPTRPRNADRLRELLSEVMVRNTRALTDLHLPPRFASTVRCAPLADEQELYQRIREAVSYCYDNARNRLTVGTLLQMAGSSPRAVLASVRRVLARTDLDPGLDALLRPLMNLSRSVPETGKTHRLVEVLRSALGQGERCVVFTRFRETLAYLEELLLWHQIPHSTFSGRMSGAEKDEAVRLLQGEVQVMLATEVGGEGRNLQCASTLINFDLPWNPMKLEQRIGRLHRIGQVREVRIHNLCAAGSAEDRILDVLDRRINMFELVVGELDMILGHMEDERGFSERVLEIYGTSSSDEELQDGFEKLGNELDLARQHYDRARELDRSLFGQDFEV